MFGYGNYDLAIGTLEKALTRQAVYRRRPFHRRRFVRRRQRQFHARSSSCSSRGPVFTDYAARMTDRDAYRRAKDIDGKLIAEMQAQQQEPANAK